MKEIEYEELNIEDDDNIFHMWEPLEFKIDSDYKYINDGIIFNMISDIIFAIISPILFILNKVLLGFRIEGKENLKKVKDIGKITISNHIHPMDCTMNGLVNFPDRTYYVSLMTNFKIPVIRHLIRILYAIPIPEEISNKEKFLKEIEKAIENKKTIHIYPEAALWPYYEDLRKFKKGAFRIAVETNAPIVPIVFKFEEPKGIFKLYKNKKCIFAKVLEPVYPDNTLDKNDRIEKLKEEVERAMEENIRA